MTEKGKAIIAYVFGWIGGLIVLVGLKDSTRDTKFHAAQAIVASAGYMLITIAYSILPIYIPFLSTALWILYLLIVVFGIIKATKEENPEIPVIGSIAKSIFGKVIEG